MKYAYIVTDKDKNILAAFDRKHQLRHYYEFYNGDKNTLKFYRARNDAVFELRGKQLYENS
jgi:hypothetical protein